MQVKYWGEWDEQNDILSKLCVQEDYVYHRPVGEYVTKRDKLIKWVKNDGTMSMPKTKVKRFSIQDATDHGFKVRDRIINDIKISVVGLIAATQQIDQASAEALGKPFLSFLTTEMQQFRDGDRQPMIDKINNVDTNVDYVWLENETGISDGGLGVFTIREYLVDQLTH